MDVEALPPNERLKKSREHQSMTREAVSLSLNLPLFTIEALENGLYENLHGEAFVTGYMRAYAALLDFSIEQTDALISDFLQQYRPETSIQDYPPPAMFSAKLSSAFQHTQYKTHYGLAAAIIVIAGLWLASLGDTDAPLRVMTTEAASLDEVQVPSELKNSVKAKADVAVIAPKPDLIALKSQLSFQFSADCWVEILDGDEKIIYASLKKAQQQLQLSGKPPFRITLGYAPGVQLSYNGRPVELNSTNADLVKLVLGNS